MPQSRTLFPNAFLRIVVDLLRVGPVPGERTNSRQRVAGSKDFALLETTPATFAAGAVEGAAARQRQLSIPLYLRVARDDFAEGFRSAYYPRSPVGSALARKSYRE